MKLTKREVELIRFMRNEVKEEFGVQQLANSKNFSELRRIQMRNLTEVIDLLTRILNESEKEE